MVTENEKHAMRTAAVQLRRAAAFPLVLIKYEGDPTLQAEAAANLKAAASLDAAAGVTKRAEQKR